MLQSWMGFEVWVVWGGLGAIAGRIPGEDRPRRVFGRVPVAEKHRIRSCGGGCEDGGHRWICG